MSSILPEIKTPPKKSHLPAWLLASTAAVESSQNQRGLLEDRITGLKKDVIVLETLIDKEKSSYATILAARANAALLRKQGAESQGNNIDDSDDRTPRMTYGLHVLPVDITNLVAQYGGAKELAVFSLTSKIADEYMSQDEAGWIGLFRQHSLVVWSMIPGTDLRMIQNVSKTESGLQGKRQETGQIEGEELVVKQFLASKRGQVLHHAAAVVRVMGFVKHLQQTRSSRRTNDIRPKVYSRRDRDVSHPLPFISADGSLGDKIMSQANTMNKDTRQEALRALEILTLLTANRLDQYTLSLLRRSGTITVMVALLTNESASVQELAAASLANLMITAPDKQDIADIDPHVVLGRCSGRNPLVALLTSPTARVNTITSIPATTPVSGSPSRWGRGTRQQTSFCMGMASKHASRALVNDWCPQHAVASSMLEDVTAAPWADSQGDQWLAFYYYSSGTEKDCIPIKLDLTSTGEIEGSGVDDLGRFIFKGKAVRSGTLIYNFTKTFMDRGNIPPDGHVSHVAFQAGASGDSSHGLWGVWEHVTGTPHFELENGGVFRFVPLCSI